jgi:hypothetical protein
MVLKAMLVKAKRAGKRRGRRKIRKRKRKRTELDVGMGKVKAKVEIMDVRMEEKTGKEKDDGARRRTAGFWAGLGASVNTLMIVVSVSVSVPVVWVWALVIAGLIKRVSRTGRVGGCWWVRIAVSIVLAAITESITALRLITIPRPVPTGAQGTEVKAKARSQTRRTTVHN